MAESSSPTYHNWQRAERQVPPHNLLRNRISGYAGHIPGLPETVQVNTSEYAEWEFDTRPPAYAPPQAYTQTHPRPNLRVNTSGSQRSQMGDSVYNPFPNAPAKVGAERGYSASPKPSPKNYHLDPDYATLSPTTGATIGVPGNRSIVPRNRIMGYKGHVQGIQETFGVITGEYQNREVFERKMNHYNQVKDAVLASSKKSTGPASPSDLAHKYHQRADEMMKREGTSAQPRSSSTPTGRPTSNGGDYYHYQQHSGGGVEGYLDQDRTASFAGYMPRKKFTIGV